MKKNIVLLKSIILILTVNWLVNAGMGVYSFYDEYRYTTDFLIMLFAHLCGVFAAPLISFILTTVFWKTYFEKYKEERLFENMYRKFIAVALVLMVYGAVFLSVTYFFILATIFLTLKKLESLVELDEID